MSNRKNSLPTHIPSKALPPPPSSSRPSSLKTSKNPSVAAFDEVSWKLASGFNPIYSEQRIDLMIANTTVIVEHVLEQLLKFKEDKFAEGIAWASHQLCLLYKIQGDAKNARHRKRVTEKIIAKFFPNNAFFSQMTHHYHEMGILLLKIGTEPHAKKYLKRALKRYETLPAGIIVRACIGDIHYRLGCLAVGKKSASVKKHFLKALSCFEGVDYMDHRCAKMNFELGVAKFNNKQWKKADSYFCNAARQFERFQDWEFLSQTYTYISQIRRKQKLLDEAQKCLEKANHFQSFVVREKRPAPQVTADQQVQPSIRLSSNQNNNTNDNQPPPNNSNNSTPGPSSRPSSTVTMQKQPLPLPPNPPSYDESTHDQPMYPTLHEMMSTRNSSPSISAPLMYPDVMLPPHTGDHDAWLLADNIATPPAYNQVYNIPSIQFMPSVPTNDPGELQSYEYLAATAPPISPFGTMRTNQSVAPNLAVSSSEKRLPRAPSRKSVPSDHGRRHTIQVNDEDLAVGHPYDDIRAGRTTGEYSNATISRSSDLPNRLHDYVKMGPAIA